MKIETLLSDGEFHSNVELSRTAGWRFGGTLHYMRKLGYEFEKKRRNHGEKGYIEYWRLLGTPSQEISSNQPIQCTLPIT